MTKVEDIEKAIKSLAPDDHVRLRDWFEEHDAKLFDQKLKRDANAGKLDKLIAKALENADAGLCEDL
jgi:hypothetical protein